MNFNDRRKAKKAASETTKAQISAMANRGTLRAANTSPGSRKFSQAERSAVQSEVNAQESKYGPVDNPGVTGSRAQRYARATQKVQGAADVQGFDGPAYRKKAEATKQPKQLKRLLPKKAGK
jgi:hypothetical protein